MPIDFTKRIVCVDVLTIKISGLSDSLEGHFLFSSVDKALVCHSVNVLLASCVEDYTVIVEVSSRSIVMGNICSCIYVELNWMRLELSRIHDSKSFGILHWNDVSCSEMEVEIVSLRTESKVLSSFE